VDNSVDELNLDPRKPRFLDRILAGHFLFTWIKNHENSSLQANGKAVTKQKDNPRSVLSIVHKRLSKPA
jgi:hypothetical protein